MEVFAVLTTLLCVSIVAGFGFTMGRDLCEALGLWIDRRPRSNRHTLDAE